MMHGPPPSAKLHWRQKGGMRGTDPRGSRPDVEITERLRRLGWWSLWLIATYCLRLWFGSPNAAAPALLVSHRSHGQPVDGPGEQVRTIAADATHDIRSCSRGSS